MCVRLMSAWQGSRGARQTAAGPEPDPTQSRPNTAASTADPEHETHNTVYYTYSIYTNVHVYK